MIASITVTIVLMFIRNSVCAGHCDVAHGNVLDLAVTKYWQRGHLALRGVVRTRSPHRLFSFTAACSMRVTSGRSYDTKSSEHSEHIIIYNIITRTIALGNYIIRD